MRVMIYSQDGMGLGHLRRTSSIANRLLRIRDDVRVLAVCDTPVDQRFGPSAHYDRLKLPTIVKRAPGQWDAVALGDDVDTVLRLRSELLRTALLSYRPDLVLVDNMPHGAMGELVAGLEALRAANPAVRVVLGLRDIIDAPEVVRTRWAIEGAYDAIERLYDRVLVYGSRDTYPLDDLYGFSPAVRARTVYCGYVVEPAAIADRAAARKVLFPGLAADRPLVAVLGGSGHDAAPIMACASACAAWAAPGEDWATVIVCGPNMPVSARHDLLAQLRPGSGWVLPSVDDTGLVLAAADAAVSMAGYNTTMEIVASGTPAVLIPRPGPSLEQRTRARIFAERGWVRMVDPDDLSPATLGDALRRALAGEDLPGPHDGWGLDGLDRRGPDLGGIDAAVAELLMVTGDGAVPEALSKGAWRRSPRATGDLVAQS